MFEIVTVWIILTSLPAAAFMFKTLYCGLVLLRADAMFVIIYYGLLIIALFCAAMAGHHTMLYSAAEIALFVLALGAPAVGIVYVVSAVDLHRMHLCIANQKGVSCGYDLRATTGSRCPECGHVVLRRKPR